MLICAGFDLAGAFLKSYMPTLPKKKTYNSRPKMKGWGDQKFLQSKAWRTARLIKLRRFPICEVHERAGTYLDCTTGGHIDHIIPRKAGGSELDYRNLMTLCRDCHSYKTGMENHRQLIEPAPGTEAGEYYPTEAAKKQLINNLAKGV